MLKNALEQLNLFASEEALFKLEQYKRLVLRWNERVNLTAITEESEFIKKHHIDSVLCGAYPEVQRAERVIDVGTGAGFPGVPLALLFPEKAFLLLDSVGKRTKIIQGLCEEIDIPNVTVLQGRAEDIAAEVAYRERFDLCVSRAVAKLPVLAEYCLPFVKPGGFFIAYKSQGAEEERASAADAVRILGGGPIEKREAALNGFDLTRIFLIIEKVAKTPAQYPRRAGTPLKKPLGGTAREVSRETTSGEIR